MMLRTQDIMAALPLVASILGDRYGVTVEIGGDTACTNGKVIKLPTLPLDCDEKLLAAARGFTDHEAAHIRDTDFEVLRQANLMPVQHNLFNSLEDWRVEQTLAALFPGCRQNFHWLIHEYFGGHNQTTDSEPSLAILNWVLLSVRSWEVPAISGPRDKEAAVMDAAFPGLRGQLEDVLTRVRQECRSTKDAIAFALELSAIIESYLAAGEKEKQPDKNAKPTTPEDSSGSPCQSDETSSSTLQAQTQPTSQAQAPFTSQTQEQLSRVARQALQDLLQASASALPKHLGEYLAETLASLRATDQRSGLAVARVSTKYAVSFSESIKREAMQASTALRTRLHGLLQTQTQQSCVIGRRGTLCSSRLYGLATNNPKIFLRNGERQSISTAVHILLDCSGSMEGTRMQLASRACYAVATALNRCHGVNVGVTAFPAANIDSDSNTVFPILRHGERLHDRFDLFGNGFTPLAEALWWVLQQLQPLREERKIILILTDGMPDSIPAAQYVLNHAQKLGVEVLGIGIQTDEMEQLLPTAKVIYDLPELAPAMFEMLQMSLLKKGAMR